MQGKPRAKKFVDRVKEKIKKPLAKYDRGTPTTMPQNFLQAMPLPKGAKEYPKSEGQIPGYRTVVRPTEEEERAKRAQAAAMAVNDGLNASMPMSQRKMIYGNAKESAPIGMLYHKHRGI